MMGGELRGQVAVVTGGASGIGRGIVLELARSGADVCIVDLMAAEEAAGLLGELERMNCRTVYAQADVRDRDAIESVGKRLEDELGPASIVVSNAITSQRHDLLQTTFDELKRAVEVGIYGAFHVLQVFSARMVARGLRGSIIQMTSPWAYLPYGGGMDYRVVKSAQAQMAASLATELMRCGIRVNTVEPGWVDTAGEHRWYSPEEMVEAGSRMPLGRLCTPEDVGRAVVYLCAEPYITGSHLKVDGGLSLTYFEASGGPGTQGGGSR